MISDLVIKYCNGNGAEIGGGGNRYIPHAIQIDKFVNSSPDSSPSADVQADACDIPLNDGVFDFVFSSHCLEHIPNPIKALLEWKRLLKKDGILFLMLPHYQKIFDMNRKRTTLLHCIEDYQNPLDPDYSHNEEIIEGWYGQGVNEYEAKEFEIAYGFSPLNFEERVKQGIIHYHVWTQNDIIELMQYIKMEIVFVTECCDERPNSFIVIGRK